MAHGDSLTNTQIQQEILHKTVMNQAYLITIMRAQAQILSRLEVTTSESVFRDMNEQAAIMVKSLYEVMEEKYK